MSGASTPECRAGRLGQTVLDGIGRGAVSGLWGREEALAASRLLSGILLCARTLLPQQDPYGSGPRGPRPAPRQWRLTTGAVGRRPWTLEKMVRNSWGRRPLPPCPPSHRGLQTVGHSERTILNHIWFGFGGEGGFSCWFYRVVLSLVVGCLP